MTVREIVTRTAVVGSGCAGLNAADCLAALGQEVLLITEGMNSGTSRNTGSDKQTYYKLGLAGDDGDSVGDLARTLCGPDVDGDIALCEAAGSARAFFKLVQLGVPFPANEMGEYVGYQTDHDTRRRASSAGPLTSRYITEALEKSVYARGVPVMDDTLAFHILTDADGVCGLLCLARRTGELLAVRCANVVLATGGPAGIYADRVYPESQFGTSGMAFAAGCRGVNLHCWQYGLASVGFRWNVSGSYQQAIPRYVSVDADGTEREFLTEKLSTAEVLNLTFLKGYQWPFDPEKTNGSSRIDLLVKEQTDLGRRVYLDYLQNPAGYDEALLSGEAREYLANCGALYASPIGRLRAINAPAIELYRAHGIDLCRKPLEVRVCAQHHNGGIGVDSNWQTDVPGLYACGEAAGTFGSRRPGGTALNSTQVGSARAAQHIAHTKRPLPAALPGLPTQSEGGPLKNCLAETCLPEIRLPCGDAAAMTAELQGAMSRHAAFVRDAAAMRQMLARIREIEENSAPLGTGSGDLSGSMDLTADGGFSSCAGDADLTASSLSAGAGCMDRVDHADCADSAKDGASLEQRLRLRDLILVQKAVLCAMLSDLAQPGVGVLETRDGVSMRRPARPLPERDLWFERVWRKSLTQGDQI